MRLPFVADRFYPGSEEELGRTVDDLFAAAGPSPARKALGVVAPHAGYIYSGALAAKTLSFVTIPQTVVLLGPNHTGMGATAALSYQDWSTPLGTVPCDRKFSQLLLQQSDLITADNEAHRCEHSLEVQLPFLQRLQPVFSVVPLTIKRISYTQCEEIADALFLAIEQFEGELLLLASTDMNHFESRKVSDKKNGLAMEAIEALDPQQLYTTIHNNNISMCGVIPVVITLLTAMKQGAKSARLVGYTDSGATSGDTAQVVGYAGFIIEK